MTAFQQEVLDAGAALSMYSGEPEVTFTFSHYRYVYRVDAFSQTVTKTDGTPVAVRWDD
jgi:hypothetical protein